MEELVSVVMSTYNEKEVHLRKSIESIINQTYQNIEYIIILDNPDNKLLYKILKEYESKDNRIKVIVNKENIGLVDSLNKGIDIAREMRIHYDLYQQLYCGCKYTYQQGLEKEKERNNK